MARHRDQDANLCILPNKRETSLHKPTQLQVATRISFSIVLGFPLITFISVSCLFLYRVSFFVMLLSHSCEYPCECKKLIFAAN